MTSPDRSRPRATLLLPGLLAAALLTPSPGTAADPTPQPRLVVQTGQSFTETAAWSPDGTLVATGGGDGRVLLWDVASGRQLHALQGPPGIVTAVQFSGDGSTLLAGTMSGELQGWNVATGATIARTQVGLFDVESFWMSGDGKQMMTAARGGTVIVVDSAAKTQSLIDISPHSLLGAALSPDHSTVAIAKAPANIVMLYDAKTGRHLRDLEGHAAQVNALRFSPDGRSLATAGDDKTIRLWDWRQGTTTRVMEGHGYQVESLEFSADGRRLMAAGVTLSLWDVATGARQDTARPRDYLKAATLSPRGDRIITIDATGAAIWNVAGGEALRELRSLAGRAKRVAFSPDGHLLAVDSVVWDLRTGRSRSTGMNTLEYRYFDWARDGKRLLADGDDDPTLWDTASWTPLKRFDAGANAAFSAALSPDGRTLVASLFDHNKPGVIRLWDVASGQVRGEWTVNDRWVRAVRFSPDGRWLAAGGGDRPVTLWDVRAGRRVHLGDDDHRPYVFAFSPDSASMAIGNAVGQVVLRPTTGGTDRLLGQHDWSIDSLRFSPDGRLLAVGGGNGVIKLWDVASGALRHTLVGHSDDVSDVDFSPDGLLLASTSDDATTRLWTVADGREIARLVQLPQSDAFAGSGVVVAPDGRFDAADLEGLRGLHWVLPDAPFRPVPLEAFMREFYEPRLLPRLLSGEPMPPVRAVTSVDPRVPLVRITGITPVDDGQGVQVDVEIERAAPGAPAPRDFRLMRDGQLVGYVDGPLALDARTGMARLRFPVRLATARVGEPVEFSAYAFNGDRVKSETAFRRHAADWMRPVGPRRAVLVNIGVDVYESPVWDLGFAASDARLISDTLASRMQALGEFDEIARVTLVSDPDTPDAATKAAIRDALRGLAKDGASGRRVGPDDVVIISFSGHGAVGRDGGFHLLPHDIGTTGSRLVTPELLARGISTDELGEWLRDLDAGEIALILDACHSAASIAQPGFKPGPMGSRGLGQLAYDKGIRILAATQPNDVALESAATQHGLLSYALVKDGIEQGLADRAPGDGRIALPEWLEYALDRVPALAAEVQAGQVATRGAPPVIRNAAGLDVGNEARSLQRPSLFDFRRKPSQTAIARP